MALFISRKELLKSQLGSDMDTTLREIERWANGLESYLGTTRYPPVNDVPVGGLSGFTIGPSSLIDTTNVTSNPIITLTTNLVKGNSYVILAHTAGSIVTAAPAFINDQVNDSAGFMGGSRYVLSFGSAAYAVNSVIAGSLSWPLTATSTTSDTFTYAATASGAGATWRHGANSTSLTLIRVA